MLKKISVGWLIVLFTLLIAPCVLTAIAGKVRYYDKYGNEISETEYKRLTGGKAYSPKPQKKFGSPLKKEAVAPVEKDQKSTDITDEVSDEEDEERIESKLNILSETIIRVFERDAEPGENISVIPVYQYLGADYGSAKIEGLSLHFQGWGRIDLGEGGFFEDDADGALLHAYLQYTHPNYGFNLRVGRQHVFKGVANESIDGVRFESVMTPYFDVSAFGGLPVGLDEINGRDGDRIWGGRIAHHMETRYEIGVSYKMIDNDSDTVEEMLGIDFFATLTSNISLNGFSARNLETEGWAEHSYEININFQSVYFRPFYQQIRYEDFFIDHETSSNIFGFLEGTDEILSLSGADLFWQGLKNVDIGATVKHYDYDLRDDNALYYSGHLTGYFSGDSQVGGEIGLMDGNTPETRYLLTRAFFYGDRPFGFLPGGFLTGDVVYVDYNEEIFDKDHSLFISLGAGMKFFSDALQTKISGDYSDDPFFDKDVRGMLVIIYEY